MNRVKKTKSAKIHQIAMCYSCGWEGEWYKTAGRNARKHTQKTGHTTVVETGTTYSYKFSERTR